MLGEQSAGLSLGSKGTLQPRTENAPTCQGEYMNSLKGGSCKSTLLSLPVQLLAAEEAENWLLGHEMTIKLLQTDNVPQWLHCGSTYKALAAVQLSDGALCCL